MHACFFLFIQTLGEKTERTSIQHSLSLPFSYNSTSALYKSERVEEPESCKKRGKTNDHCSVAVTWYLYGILWK